jgi:hypothetical protein
VKAAAIALSVGAFAAGLAAARLWYLASDTPRWSTIDKSAAQNRMAALWTAASVVLGAGASFLTALAN